MGITSIEWTDLSINPIRLRNTKTGATGHYCEKCSSGCANCYSSRFQPRFFMPTFGGRRKWSAGPTINARGTVDIGPDLELFLDEERLTAPLRRNKPAKWFVCDMTDLFGKWVPFEWIDRMFAVFALCPQHTFQVLTKRTEIMAEYTSAPTLPGRIYRLISDWLDDDQKGILGRYWEKAHNVTEWRTDGDPTEPEWILPLPNVWLGTSVEDQKTSGQRIPHLIHCSAAVRFLSMEPLLEAVKVDKALPRFDHCEEDDGHQGCEGCDGSGRGDCSAVRTPGIDWVIVGGESGASARPFDVAWARSIVGQCKTAGVACFMKQLGGHVIDRDTTSAAHFEPEECWPDGTRTDGHRVLLRNSKGGDWSEWPLDLRVREFPMVKSHGRAVGLGAAHEKAGG